MWGDWMGEGGEETGMRRQIHKHTLQRSQFVHYFKEEPWRELPYTQNE